MGRSARRGLTLVCCVLPGCAQIAGIEETSSGERSSVTFTRVSVGATVERTPLDFNGLGATYLVPDETQPDGLRRDTPTLSEDGATWSAMVPTGTPLMFQLPDYPTPTLRIWDLPNADLQGLFAVYEHPAPEPAPDDAMFAVNATLPTAFVAEERFSLLSVGTWNARSWSDPISELPLIDPPTTTFMPPAFVETMLSKAPGDRPYEKISTADAVLVLRYTPPKLTAYLEAAPFEQTGNDTIAGTMTAVTDDQTLAIQVAPADVAPRYATLRPAMPAPSMTWNLIAAPGADLGLARGPSLLSGTVLATDTGMIAPGYGNPFAAKGWKSIFQWSTSSARTYTPPDQTLAVALGAATQQVVDAAGAPTLDLPAPIPEVITLGGMTLSSDGLTFAQPAAPVPVSLVLGAGAAPTLYSVELLEIAPNDANTALVRTRVVLATGVRPDFMLPPELFETGKMYNLRASVVVGGYPALADGDLTVRELPVASSSMDSGVFTVVAP
jgi:hypothetical protein